ncbi:hypothetical protein A2574_04055 [Candidatus Shapirobacteria bacterium RIFOXYD1_FULL_38_32]|uniref:TraC-like domain-containing protein n=3 Tax=Candidatus Shapironibacteriota TaxID=1752721 RepID=A0A1F7SSF2_9BACT|nr:MAG: hypothetical protein UT14_C0005G0005 [Candidatus Shapirobacteria bacterium GW2011_GWE1_38_92]OGL56716.1 MAG: hypothetical protein A2367_03530 [Candidatus Shapirobacteria bacterium RIFOXYB1_FULL_38_38]OGL56734.1 MAG: hypothetical protein A2410_02155 [Candidatus Shapirobacteria bacterium RIFOXYC1_FULL_38_24]OGL56770.1 MAG: hypothetical protein A2195_00080 [Candidatus Shapirobacteria bacterium RIFOXYA1_FULL_39_17]OGL58290.1 MAG: hypothetical protein A2574_04055 [Candidatus Shapirobacteria 
MPDPLKIAIKGSTQDHLPIEDIVDGMVLQKDGSCSVVLQVSSVNFDLLSEREQQALVYAYGGILNSLNFTIQIIINSNTKDVSSYLTRLSVAEEKQTNLLLKSRIKSYRKFIEETVKKNDVLSKSFYIAIPFSTLELGMKDAGSQIVGSFFSRIKPKEEKLPFEKDYILEKAKAALEPKKDHLVRLFSRLGLDISPLNTKELIQLFYKIYNEETAANQKVQTLNYDAPVVTTKK